MQEIVGEDLRKIVRPGSRILLGSMAGVPSKLIEAFLEQVHHFYGLELVHLLTLGGCPWTDTKYLPHLSTNSLFLGPGSREAVAQQRAEYTPCFLSEIPSLFRDGTLPIDVAMVQITPPDQMGYCSLGVSADIQAPGLRQARLVIAEINENMPYTYGSTLVHKSEIDYFLKANHDIPEYPSHEPNEAAIKIGEYVSMLVEDGDTIQIGLGKIMTGIGMGLRNHKNLGLHSEMLSDATLDLIKRGVIDNTKKIADRNKSVISFCMGSKELYDYIDQNPHVEFRSSEYVNRPSTIANHDHMVSINTAIEVDLSGQVVADSVGFRLYSGVGGQVDFIRGTGMAKHGRPIIALPSTALDGTVSRIVPWVKEGAGVVTSRGDVHYVVTEFGIATLRGRTIRERALELIQVAHPKFREELMQQIREKSWAPPSQNYSPELVEDMGDIEMKKVTCGEQKFFIRPLMPADEKHLLEFFYSHDQESLKQRYRSIPKYMSRERCYTLCNTNQKKDLAICLVNRMGPREVIHGVARYYHNEELNSAELAIIVDQNLRVQGLATALMDVLLEVSERRKIKTMIAYVRSDNQGMKALLEKYGFVGKTDPDDPAEFIYKRFAVS
ncbi:MAG: GNAT family N-acetyltransferase [Lentisphaeria bacterium]|nr:GNAT family N-acetyltransferase [Lentisphaeria bacterium]